ncbi:MAG: hypothetical protein H7832_14300 [Magnetococcus sp. DMHC-6]
MMRVLIMAFFVFMGMVGTVSAQEFYKEGAFTVRKVEGACKLEIALPLDKEKDTAAILAIFPKDEYYGELFTERKRIGLAQKKVDIIFDKEKPRSINFVPKTDGNDDYWRWQYLESTKGMLDEVKRRNNMVVKFSNGKKSFEFTVSLKGSTKAVTTLLQCK